MRRLAVLFVLLFIPLAGLTPALAQDAAPRNGAVELPQWQSTTVNDFAGLLVPEDARIIDKALTALRDDTGIEGTVVTLPDRARYGGADGLEPFATRLFNHWGVGDARRNDGFMLLVLSDTHEARIELGRGYHNDADILAQDIMRGAILPAFRDGRMSQGIRDGTQAVIDRIARPTAAGNGVASARRSLLDRAAPFLFGGVWLLILGGMARQIWRRNRCPQCGTRGLQKSATPDRIAQPDGSQLVAQEQVTRRCPHCGWSESRPRQLPRMIWYDAAGHRLRSETNPAYRDRSGGGSSGFGGGSSRGGGASGRW